MSPLGPSSSSKAAQLVSAMGQSAPPAAAASLMPEPATTATASATATDHGQRRAYVTLLTRDAYLPGVQALHRSLLLVESRYPLIVMYTKGVSQAALHALSKEGMTLHFTEQFEAEGVDHSEYKRSLYLECWNKLRMWEMVQYDRLVYLDADMILLHSVDHLFALPPGFYAVGDCYGGREYEEERNSCCHFTPEATPEYFNAGFYVMIPSLAELEGMKAALREGRVEVRFFAEQDFLNGYFKGRWKHLPLAYNAQKRIKYHHPEQWDLSAIHIIHYVDEKPWSHRYSEENLKYRQECDYWWDVYEGRLAPRQQVVRQMSTGLTSLDSFLSGMEEQQAPSAATLLAPRPGSASASGTPPLPVPVAAGAGGGLERAGSLSAALPHVRAT